MRVLNYIIIKFIVKIKTKYDCVTNFEILRAAINLLRFTVSTLNLIKLHQDYFIYKRKSLNLLNSVIETINLKRGASTCQILRGSSLKRTTTRLNRLEPKPECYR